MHDVDEVLDRLLPELRDASQTSGPSQSGEVAQRHRLFDAVSRAIVAGDRDGVVVVPLAEARAVAKQLALVRRKEAETLKAVTDGTRRQFWDEAGLRARGAVRFVD